jgi:hypothetical protein
VRCYEPSFSRVVDVPTVEGPAADPGTAVDVEALGYPDVHGVVLPVRITAAASTDPVRRSGSARRRPAGLRRSGPM